MAKRKSAEHKHHAHHGHQNQTELLKSAKPVQPLVITVLIALLAIVGIVVVYKSHAAGDSMTVTPSSSTIALGSSFTVTIAENSNTDTINAVEADLTYDQSKLQFVKVDTSANANFNGSAGACPSATGGGGNVSVACAKFGTGLTGSQTVATVTFTALATGSTSVNFASSSVLVTTSQVSITPVFTNGSYTIADQSPPTTPTGLTSGTQNVTSLGLNWTASTDNVGVTGYNIYRGTSSTSLSQIGTITGTSYIDINLTPNTTYYYAVSAHDAAGNNSPQTTALAVKTKPDTTPPSVPGPLTVGTRTVTSVAFSWGASTDNVAMGGYNVYRNGTLLKSTTSTSYTDTGLTPNTNYSYTVSAFDTSNNTSAQSTALATSTLPDTTAPSVPTGIISPTQSTISIALSWNASTDNVGVAGYKIFRNGTLVGTSATSSFNDTSLNPNTVYSYTIAAYDGAGNTSAQSSASSFSTKSNPGDANGDGTVNIFDLSILASHWGQSGQTFSTGDFNGDGTVNIFDLSILAANWGK